MSTIKAGEVIDGTRLEYRPKGGSKWMVPSAWEYRLRPEAQVRMDCPCCSHSDGTERQEDGSLQCDCGCYWFPDRRTPAPAEDAAPDREALSSLCRELDVLRSHIETYLHPRSGMAVDALAEPTPAHADEVATWKCSKCEAEQDSTWARCHRCGTPRQPAEQRPDLWQCDQCGKWWPTHMDCCLTCHTGRNHCERGRIPPTETPAQNCEACAGTGWYGDNGPGKKGNTECQPCDQCGAGKAAAPEVCQCGHQKADHDCEDRICWGRCEDSGGPHHCLCKQYRPAAAPRCEKHGVAMAYSPDDGWVCAECETPAEQPESPRCPTCGSGNTWQLTSERWICVACEEGWRESRRKPCPGCAWKQGRLDALQQAQKDMRDPERTMVCDILANGKLLEPPGDRYAVKPCQECGKWAGAMGREASARCAAEKRVKELEEGLARWQTAFCREASQRKALQGRIDRALEEVRRGDVLAATVILRGEEEGKG